jgi:hypothetical protein
MTQQSYQQVPVVPAMQIVLALDSIKLEDLLFSAHLQNMPPMLHVANM